MRALNESFISGDCTNILLVVEIFCIKCVQTLGMQEHSVTSYNEFR